MAVRGPTAAEASPGGVLRPVELRPAAERRPRRLEPRCLVRQALNGASWSQGATAGSRDAEQTSPITARLGMPSVLVEDCREGVGQVSFSVAIREADFATGIPEGVRLLGGVVASRPFRRLWAECGQDCGIRSASCEPPGAPAAAAGGYKRPRLRRRVGHPQRRVTSVRGDGRSQHDRPGRPPRRIRHWHPPAPCAWPPRARGQG